MCKVRSVSQAFAILRLLSERGPLSLSNVARLQGLSASSCLAILRTLVAEGALERCAASKLYRLTPEWSAAGPLSTDRMQRMIDRLRPTMQKISKTYEATIGLWKEVAGQRLKLVTHVESGAPMRIQMASEQRQPLGGGVVGRILSAVQGVDDDVLALRFAETRWERPISVDRYIQEVKLARERGFAVDDGILHAGICSVAVALPASCSDFLLSLSVFAGSRSDEEIGRIGRGLVEWCGKLG
ncbi:IclR family transcriptional regulator [Sphingobium herbicidovorans NBRC 16415]|uniref:IclR family transcriptional regulator n=2 Tax=Sphingobium herbicidovorans TaxID=76947 RepID=A0A086PBX7_SPHHM|nr:IclR family transcriptional regulator [Sphingobium herbicidovorans NBRC 16415]